MSTSSSKSSKSSSNPAPVKFSGLSRPTSSGSTSSSHKSSSGGGGSSQQRSKSSSTDHHSSSNGSNGSGSTQQAKRKDAPSSSNKEHQETSKRNKRVQEEEDEDIIEDEITGGSDGDEVVNDNNNNNNKKTVDEDEEDNIIEDAEEEEQQQQQPPKRTETPAPTKKTATSTTANAAASHPHPPPSTSTTTSSSSSSKAATPSTSSGGSEKQQHQQEARNTVVALSKPLPDEAQRQIEALKDFNGMRMDHWIKECGHFDPMVLWQINKSKDQVDTEMIKSSLNIHKQKVDDFKFKVFPYKTPEAPNGFILTFGKPASKGDSVIQSSYLTPMMMMVYMGTGIDRLETSSTKAGGTQGPPKLYAGFSDAFPEDIRTKRPAIVAQMKLFMIHTEMYSRKIIEHSLTDKNRDTCWPKSIFESTKAQLIKSDEDKYSAMPDKQLDEEVRVKFIKDAQKFFNRKQNNGVWECMTSISRRLTREMNQREKATFAPQIAAFEKAMKADPESVSDVDKLMLQGKVWVEPYIEETGNRLAVDYKKGLNNPCPSLAYAMNIFPRLYAQDSNDSKKPYGIQLGFETYKNNSSREIVIVKRYSQERNSEPAPKTCFDDEKEGEEGGDNPQGESNTQTEHEDESYKPF